ncbi:MAG: hypothetical protein AAGB04_02145 [Pseudomonadota bacterium]
MPTQDFFASSMVRCIREWPIGWLRLISASLKNLLQRSAKANQLKQLDECEEMSIIIIMANNKLNALQSESAETTLLPIYAGGMTSGSVAPI